MYRSPPTTRDRPAVRRRCWNVARSPASTAWPRCDRSGEKTAATNWVGIRLSVTAAANAPSVVASTEEMLASQGTEPLLASNGPVEPISR